MLPAAVIFNGGMPTRKPLDDLMNKAKEYAEFTMRNGDCVPPTMLALTPEGPVLERKRLLCPFPKAACGSYVLGLIAIP